METITTHKHPLIQHIIELHHAKGRKKHKQFIAEGIRTISTLIDAGHIPLNLFVTTSLWYNKQHSLAQLSTLCPIHIIKESVIKKMSTSTTASGVLAQFSIPPQPDLDQLSPGVVLAMIQDPGNAGTLIRTAAAMNKKTAVCIDSVDPWSPKVVQSTAGTIGFIDIFVIDFTSLITHKKNIPLVALIAHDGALPHKQDLSHALIVVGNEAHGIPQQWIDLCDKKITLPMPGKSESLNAAVAGSIALYLATV